MELLKLLSVNEIAAQLVCFLILLAVLRIVLWKRVLAMLDARRAKALAELKAIEESKMTLSNIKRGYDEKLATIEGLTRAKIEEGIVEGKRLAEEIRRKAEEESDKIVRNAKDTIKDELAKAKEELKNTMTDLTVDVAAKVLQERLTEEQDRRLVEDFLKGMEK